MAARLFNRGFLSLIVTQFFGAANDNLLKYTLTVMVITGGVWAGQLGDGGQGIVGLCLTLPFILLSGYAGQFADRNSKQYVARLVKIIEIPIAALACFGFVTHNLPLTLLAMVLLACQSAYFGPAKYGMIPELVGREQLSRANGVINMLTNIAVIAGTVAGGMIADRYNPLPPVNPSPWLPGIALIIMAVLGLLAVLFLPPLVPGDRGLRYDWNPLATYIHAIRDMAKGPLLTVALAWGYFYLLAGLALLIIPEYPAVLGITVDPNTKSGIIFAVMAVAIGLGSIAAGVISGPRIEVRLVVVGAAGIIVLFALLGIIPPTFLNVCVLIGAAGICAGLYIVPLQALLQHYSPDDERGRFLGTANGISFLFLSIAALGYWIVRPAFGTAPHRGFLICSALMLIGGLLFLRPILRIGHKHP
ncbi:MAG: MFS transporter [Phycisphaerales bacterium]